MSILSVLWLLTTLVGAMFIERRLYQIVLALRSIAEQRRTIG
jgi:hypothetical protein